MKNIHDFNRCTAKVFTILYEAFPKPVVLFVEAFDDDADKETIRNYLATVKFLKDEGFIRYEGAKGGGVFDDVVLTAKGLAVLSKMPDTIKDKATLIERIRSVLKDGSKEALKNIIQEVIRAIV